jgi:protein-tyrosine phosphatase
MIDLHAHILPGVDDGPATLREALAILEAAADDGVRTIAATPHVRDDYPTTPEAMERGVAGLARAVERASIPIQIVRGGEIAHDRLGTLTVEELRRFTLGGSGRYVLIETPYVGWPLDLATRLFELQVGGLSPVLAHPERNFDVQSRPGLLRPLVARGVLVQVTAASVDGRLGKRSASTARTLLQTGCAHLIASDAHTPQVRRVGLSDAASSLGDGLLARWLVHDVPLAIIAGRSPPERPPSPVRRRRFAPMGRGPEHGGA